MQPFGRGAAGFPSSRRPSSPFVIPGPAQREPGIHARSPDAAWIPAQAWGLPRMTVVGAVEMV